MLESGIHLKLFIKIRCNFFVTEESLGKPRAEVVTELLCEMNPDAKGTANVAQYTNDLLVKELAYFIKFNLIIVANMPEEQLLPLSEVCSTHGIPLMAMKSYGFLGRYSINYSINYIINLIFLTLGPNQSTFVFEINNSSPPSVITSLSFISFSFISVSWYQYPTTI